MTIDKQQEQQGQGDHRNPPLRFPFDDGRCRIPRGFLLMMLSWTGHHPAPTRTFGHWWN